LFIQYLIFKVSITNVQYRISNKKFKIGNKAFPLRGNGKGALRDNGCRPLWILKNGILLGKRSFLKFFRK
jgi:hypothetical protein